MIKKIDHFVITTLAIDNCLQFYKKLGFNVLQTDERYELFAGDFKINVHILNHELLPHAQHIQPGSADLCFQLDCTIQEFNEFIESNGISSFTGIVQRHGVQGEMKSLYVNDPNGNLLEFCSYE